MKATRRHKLQTNALAIVLEHLPEHILKYGSYILLVVVVAGLVAALLYYRTSAANERQQRALDKLATARSLGDQLRSPAMVRMSEEQIASLRRDIWSEAGRAIDDIETDDPKILSEALIVKGDLAWWMANSPDLPGATTRPALRMETDRSELLKMAQAAYDEVLNKYLGQRFAAASAHFGLAAIAENRADWDEAGAQYKTLIEDPSMPQGFRNQAIIRWRLLNQIQHPLMLAGMLPTTNPTSQPTTQQATMPPVFPTTSTSVESN